MRFWFALALTLSLFPGLAMSQSTEDPDEPPPAVVPTTPDPAPAATPPPSPAPTPTESDVTELPPPEKAPPPPPESRVSWTALGGQIPEGTMITTVAFGLSGLPQASFHYGLAPNMSLGVAGGFDYARYVPSAAFNAAAYVAASFKTSIHLDETLHLGIRADAGILVPEVPDFGIIIDLSANLMAPVTNQVFVGAGLDIPITIGIGDGSGLAWPLLFGGIAEVRILPPLSLFAEAKLGPAFLAPGGVTLGVRLMGGLAYRL